MKKIISINILFIILCFSLIGCNHNPDSNNSTDSTESTTTTESTDNQEQTTESTDNQEQTTDNFPKLKIVNKGQITILKVVLEGYEFSDLNLKQNQSIILDLNNGMPGGYKDVQISIRYRPYKVSNSPIPPILTKLDFADGKTTTLTIKSKIF